MNVFLLIQVLKASLITTTGCFAVALVIPALKLNLTPTQEEITGLILGCLPGGMAAWWMFGKLQARYTRRAARLIAIALAVSTPVSLLIAVFLAETPGSFAALLWNPLGVLGAFAGIVLVTAVLNWGPCMLVSWLAGRASKRAA